jgi:hypothetical protein
MSCGAKRVKKKKIKYQHLADISIYKKLIVKIVVFIEIQQNTSHFW